MAEHMFDDQQQQNQIQPYGVSFGIRAKSRGVPYLPHVPAIIGAPNLRARQLPAQPVREQQQDVMLQDNVRVNQDMLQHNIQQQDNIAYNRRQYVDPQPCDQVTKRTLQGSMGREPRCASPPPPPPPPPRRKHLDSCSEASCLDSV